MTFQCERYGLVVDEILQFKPDECPDDIQHYFKPNQEAI